MSKISGIKLDFSNKDDDKVSVIAGKQIKPHRIELIKEKIKTKNYDGLDELFFNFHVKGCSNASTLSQCEEESALYDEYKNIMRPADEYFTEKVEVSPDVA